MAATKQNAAVGLVIIFDEPQTAVRLTNATRYGFTATNWTRDVTLAGRVRAGSVWVNGWGAIRTAVGRHEDQRSRPRARVERHPRKQRGEDGHHRGLNDAHSLTHSRSPHVQTPQKRPARRPSVNVLSGRIGARRVIAMVAVPSGTTNN